MSQLAGNQENQQADAAREYTARPMPGKKAKAEPVPAPISASTETVSGKRLKSFIERIERVLAEQAERAADVKEIYAEVKSCGFETRIVRKLIRLRAMDVQARREESEILDLYSAAIGLE